MVRRRKRNRGLKGYKRKLWKGDRRRIKMALNREDQDERRAYKKHRYNPWAWY